MKPSIARLLARSGVRKRSSGFFESLEPRALMAAFTVTTLNDAGPGSLRQAILDSNAAAGADVIDFQAGLTGSINLASGQLSITDSLTINGPAANLLTVSGQDASRIFSVADGDAPTEYVVFSGLTLAHGMVSGSKGGALLVDNAAVVTMYDCAVVDSFSSQTGGGIAVYNGSSLTIMGSLLARNTTGGDGGGVFTLNSNLSISNSTISGNSAANWGGGIGCFTATPTTVTVRNCTIVGNMADSDNDGNGVGGGVHPHWGTWTIVSSIIAGNHNSDVNTPDDAAEGTLNAIDSTNNLVLDAATAGGLINGQNGNLVGIDPLIGSLADNGGPTQTFALPEGSPAIGQGINTSGLINDQRGALFTRGDAVDIGAYQRQRLNLVVDASGDQVDGNVGADHLTLREAITATNANPGADGISFAGGLNGGAIILGGAAMSVSGGLTITGPGADRLTISAANLSRVFDFVDGSSILTGLTIASGGVSNSASLYIADSLLTGTDFGFNSGDGGGALNTGTLTVYRSTISGNRAANGAGLSSYGTMFVSSSTITGNGIFGMGSSSGGGGIYSDGPLYVSSSTITNNQTGLYGGGIFAQSGAVQILNSTIIDNSVDDLDLRGSAVMVSSITGVAHTTFDNASSNNLVQDAGSPGGLVDGQNGNIVGVDPQLGALASNGGLTQTMALIEGSPAIGHGSNPSGNPYDQRGGVFTRGNPVDIGAYQRQTLSVLVDTLADVDDGNYSVGNLSLREAVAVAGLNPGIDTVTFDPALNGGTIALNGTPLALTGDLSISGPGHALLTISAGNASRVFDAAANSSAQISGLTIAQGGITNAGVLVVADSVINGTLFNSVYEGGGVFNLGTFYLRQSTVTGNQAWYGAGLANHGVMSIDGSTVSNNSLTGNGSGGGGGILSDLTLYLTNSTISGNQSGVGGGGLRIYGGGTFIYNSTIAGNTYDQLSASNSDVTLFSSIVSGGSWCISGTVNAASMNNLVQDAATAGGLTTGVNGNLIGVDPLLGPLADNGGPTQTMAISAASPAIGKGQNLMALTADQRGNAFVRSRGGAIDIGAVEYDGPTVATLNTSTATLHRTDHFTLTALPGPDDEFQNVAFYRDADGDGIPDVGELIGTSTGGPDGFALDYQIDGSTPLGSSTFLAIATDGQNRSSLPTAASVTVVKRPFSVASFTMSTAHARLGQDVTFTAGGLSNPDGSPIARIEVHLLLTDHGGTNDSVVAEDTTGGDGWTWTVNTTSWGIGKASDIGPAGYNGHRRYYVVAIDVDSASTDPVYSTDFDAFEVLGGYPVLGASGGTGGNINVTSGSSLDLPRIFQQQGGSSSWTWSDLKAKTGCPDITGELVTWVDSKDGRTYAAAMSASGLLLFTNTSGANWTFRNLGAEVPGTAQITGNLTTFTSIDGVVSLAGVAANGDLIRYFQTGEGSSGHYLWSSINHGDELRDQGLALPQFAGRITSFVTPWNALNIVGLDADGHIQAIWYHASLQTGGRWTTNDLSAQTGAPQLTGGLTVWITSWNAINIAGTDAGGNLSATWWVPGFNNNLWNVSDLTQTIGGPKLEASSMTSWVTSWGAMNIAGREADGTMGVYWWVPNYNDNHWNIAHFRDLVPGSTPTVGPVSGVTALSGDYSMSILSTSASGDVTRLWWSPTTNAWAEQNLTQVAVPA